MTRVRVRPEAERDVDAAAEHYAREASVDVALRFLAAVEESYQRLAEFPASGTVWLGARQRLSGLRFVPVPSFDSYLVFHIASSEDVEVIRVLHGARDILALIGDIPPR